MKTIFFTFVIFIMMAGVGYAEKECSTNLAVMPCNMTSTNFSIYTGTYYCPADDCFTINASNPPTNIYLNGSTFYVNDSNANGGLVFNSNNLIINGNNSIIIGNKTGTTYGVLTYGIVISSYKNITLDKLTISNYYMGISITRGSGTSYINITNSIIKDNTRTNIFMGGSNYSELNNVSVFGARVEHGIYIDSQVANHSVYIKIRNSQFYNNTKMGIHLNPNGLGRIFMPYIYNNIIWGNGETGINDLGSLYGNISYNQLYSNTKYGLAIAYNVGNESSAAANTNYLQNTLYSNVLGEVLVYNWTQGNILQDNIFSDGTARYKFTQYSINLSVNINETSTNFHVLNNTKDNWLVYFNYNGRKDIQVVNNTVSWSNKDGNHTKTMLANEVFYVTSESCANPYLAVPYGSSTRLCGYPNIYNLNSTASTNGAIYINSSNTVLDCDGATLIGNNTGQGIRIVSYQNVTIKNCNIRNYYRNILFGDSATTRYNNTIINNTLMNSYSNIYLTYQAGILIENNTIYNCTTVGTVSYGIFGSYNPKAVNYYNTINNNRINGLYKCFAGVFLDFASDYFNITNNEINSTDVGVMVQDSRNILMNGNVLRNQTARVDYYQTGIELHDEHVNGVDVINITILNNNIIKAGSTGIDIHSGKNITIQNNNISLLTIAEKRALFPTDCGATCNYMDDGGDPSCAIQIVELRKGFFDDTNDNTPITYAMVSNYSAGNISIFDTILGDDTECYLKAQGTTGLNTDLLTDYPSYYYKKYQIPRDYIDATEMWIPKNTAQLQMFRPYSGFINEPLLWWSYGTTTGAKGKFWFSYLISEKQLMFTNTNDTRTLNLSLFNLTDQGYPYTDVFNGSTATPQCTDVNECNVTLGPNERAFVFSYSSATQPRLTSIDTTISTINYALGSDLQVNCTGTGGFTVSNLDYFGSTVYVYHNDELVETLLHTTDYAATGCSDWLFTGSDREYFNSEVKPNLVTSYLVFASMMSLIVIIAMIGGIIFLIFQFKSGRLEFNFENLSIYLKGGAFLLIIATFVIIVTVILITVGANILG